MPLWLAIWFTIELGFTLVKLPSKTEPQPAKEPWWVTLAIFEMAALIVCLWVFR